VKVIFLDIDGVLALECRGQVGWPGIDVKLVEILNTLLRQVDAHIVLCSVWRGWSGYRDENQRLLERFNLNLIPIATDESFSNDCTYEALQSNLHKVGCVGRLHTDWATSHLFDQPRAVEIADWLDRHPEVSSYVILDDIVSGHTDLSHLVAVNPRCGLQSVDIDRAIEILSGLSGR